MTRLKVVQSALFALALALLVSALPNTANADPIPNGDTTALIDAIDAAAPGDTIELAKNGTYVLTGSQIVIDTVIIIEGNGATIDGDDLSRVFFVQNTGDLTLNNLTVTGGNASGDQGGGIYNRGMVTLNESSVSHNTAGFGGGGIFNPANAMMTLNESSVSHNTAGLSGGGISNTGGLTQGGTMTLNKSSVSHNTTTGGSGGGIFNSGTVTTMTLNESSVGRNTAGGSGGGIINSVSATMTLNESSVSHNTAVVIGGGIFNSGSAMMTLNESTVDHNTAGDDGGGIFNDGTVDQDDDSSIEHNHPNDCVGCP